jgi:hypothetical protein
MRTCLGTCFRRSVLARVLYRTSLANSPTPMVLCTPDQNRYLHSPNPSGPILPFTTTDGNEKAMNSGCSVGDLTINPRGSGLLLARLRRPTRQFPTACFWGLAGLFCPLLRYPSLRPYPHAGLPGDCVPCVSPSSRSTGSRTTSAGPPWRPAPIARTCSYRPSRRRPGRRGRGRHRRHTAYHPLLSAKSGQWKLPCQKLPNSSGFSVFHTKMPRRTSRPSTKRADTITSAITVGCAIFDAAA